MKQVLIELDDELAKALDGVAPARSRQRSEFIRQAIRQALWALEEAATREAYERMPDDLSDYAFDARTWEPWTEQAPARRKASVVAESAPTPARAARVRRTGRGRTTK